MEKIMFAIAYKGGESGCPDGGNFFCLDLTDGNVCFYATDSFDADSWYAANHAKAYRWLASSFAAFVDGLKDESEIDL